MATTAPRKTTKKVPAPSQPKPAAAKAAPTAKPAAAKKRDTETTEKVLEQLQTGGQNAIGAVRRFIDSTDESLRGGRKEPTFVRDIVDSALEMSDRMVEHGGETLRGIVRSGSNR